MYVGQKFGDLGVFVIKRFVLETGSGSAVHLCEVVLITTEEGNGIKQL